MSEQRVACIGECMVEFSQAPGAMYRRSFAGDTFNTAWYLRRLLPGNHAVRYVTRIGDDRQSKDMLAFMQTSGIDTGCVDTMRGATCGLYTISLDNGERSFSYWRGQSAARTLANSRDRLKSALQGFRCIVFSGITLAILPQAGRENLLEAARLMKSAGATIVFDPNVRRRLWANDYETRQWLTAAYALSDIALPSFADERDLFGDQSLEATAQRVHAAGAREVVVKDGSRTCLLSFGGAVAHVAPEIDIVPVDTTGAGDSFNAAYLAARLQGETPVAAAKKAHALAGRVIQGFGALVSL